MIEAHRIAGVREMRDVQNIVRYTNISGKRAYVALVFIIVFAAASGPWAFAEDAAPVDPPQDPPAPTVVKQPIPEAPAEPDPPVVIDALVIPEPVPPTEPEPPVIPEPELPADPTPEQPAPDVPVIPQPVEPAPAETGAPAIQEPLPTETPAPTATLVPTPEPTATPSPTPEPSPTPSPTPEPTPVVTWNQTEQVNCVLRDGQAAGLKYAESRTYRCEVSANVASDIEMPADIDIEWTVNVSFPDSYVLQFPQGSQANVKQQLSGASATATKYTITHPWQQSSAQKLTFDLVVTRTTCAVGEQALTVQASPEIDTHTSEAEINRSGGTPNRAIISTEFLPNTETPVASMTPVDFGSLEWDGESWGTATATSTITVTNNEPCATSQANTIQLQINASDPGMTPMLVSVDTDQSGFTAIEGDGTIARIPAGFSGSATLNVEFELTPPNDVFEGDYTFGFEVTVTAVP